MPDTAFAGLGRGQIAYVRPMTAEAIKAAFPAVPPLEPGLSLWALLNADGTPILVTDSRDAALQNARENDLQTVSLH